MTLHTYIHTYIHTYCMVLNLTKINNIKTSWRNDHLARDNLDYSCNRVRGRKINLSTLPVIFEANCSQSLREASFMKNMLELGILPYLH